MRGLLLFLLAAVAAFGANDEWAKVKDLKTGTEIRVFKKGSSQPVQAQMDELTDDNLVVIVKKTETAIPRDQIVRIDARPASGSRTTKETVTKDAPPTGDPAGKPESSTNTSVTFGSKPDFVTVYRRPPAAPKK